MKKTRRRRNILYNLHLLAFKARKAAKGGNSPTTSGAPPPPNLDNQVGAELGMGEATPPTHVIDESNVETKRKKTNKKYVAFEEELAMPENDAPGSGSYAPGSGPRKSHLSPPTPYARHSTGTHFIDETSKFKHIRANHD